MRSRECALARRKQSSLGKRSEYRCAAGKKRSGRFLAVRLPNKLEGELNLPSVGYRSVQDPCAANCISRLVKESIGVSRRLEISPIHDVEELRPELDSSRL